MGSAASHEGLPACDGTEDRHVTGQDHHVETAAQVQVGEILLDPREAWRPPTCLGDHRRGHVYAYDIYTACCELYRHPAGSATGVENPPRCEGGRQPCLAVDVRASTGESIESLLVGPPVESGFPRTLHHRNGKGVPTAAGLGLKELTRSIFAPRKTSRGATRSNLLAFRFVSEVSLRYQRVSDGFDVRLKGVAEGQWTLPTPCEDWDVTALVSHVITTHWRLHGSAGREADPAGDLVSQWSEATAAVASDIADPERSSRTVSGMFGDQTFESLVSRLLCSDTLFHTWDLARATGQDEDLDEDAVAKALEFLTPMDEAIRRPGGFAPKIEPAAGADLQTRLLNFGGRSV